ncbi:MAG: GAF domain-containing protein [Candidatus Binatus sp.]
MTDKKTDAVKAPEFLSGNGETVSLMRSRDWSHTSLGPPHNWPDSLKTVVRIMLDSRYAIWIGWGPELTFLYNDAYREMTLGKKHPWALGRPAHEVWAEAWPDLSPRVEEVVKHGKATYDEDLFLLLERSGFPEETYHTFSYSPLPDDNGKIGGLLCIVVEDTNRYIAERRLTVLRETAALIANTRELDELFAAIGRSVGANLYDTPFSLIYLIETDGSRARLVSHTEIDASHPAAPGIIQTGVAGEPWPIREVLARSELILINDLAKRFPNLPAGAWRESPHSAVAVPIRHQGQEKPAGVLIAGLNPYRPFNDNYRGFINLLAGQVAAGLADVRAYEEERKRAEALAEINRAKTTFFSNASHEFRTPLTLMLSPLEDLLGRDGTSGAVTARRDEIELIHRNGLRLLRLVNTLLDFSRIEAGRFEGVYEPTDLAAYTAELASTFRSAMDQAGLGYVIDCEPLPETAYVDRDMWEKIVLNLLSNAFKYTLEGEIGVSLKLPPGGKARSSRCATRVPASRGMRYRACSSAFIVSRVRSDEPTKAPASGWLSYRNWCGFTAVTFAWTPRPEKDRRSSLRCRLEPPICRPIGSRLRVCLLQPNRALKRSSKRPSGGCPANRWPNTQSRTNRRCVPLLAPAIRRTRLSFLSPTTTVICATTFAACLASATQSRQLVTDWLPSSQRVGGNHTSC